MKIKNALPLILVQMTISLLSGLTAYLLAPIHILLSIVSIIFWSSVIIVATRVGLSRIFEETSDLTPRLVVGYNSQRNALRLAFPIGQGLRRADRNHKPRSIPAVGGTLALKSGRIITVTAALVEQCNDDHFSARVDASIEELHEADFNFGVVPKGSIVDLYLTPYLVDDDTENHQI